MEAGGADTSAPAAVRVHLHCAPAGAAKAAELLAAESAATRERAERQRLDAQVASLQDEQLELLQGAVELKARCEEAERRAELAEVLTARQAMALKKLGDENLSLLQMLHELPAYAGPVAADNTARKTELPVVPALEHIELAVPAAENLLSVNDHDRPATSLLSARSANPHEPRPPRHARTQRGGRPLTTT